MSVADDVREAGLSITHVLSEIGVILGEGSDEIASKIRTLEGITDVSLNKTVRLNPSPSNDD
jgi:hypothetical protein